MYQIVHQVYTDVDSGVTSCHGSVPILVDTLLIDMTSVFHGTFHWSSDSLVFSQKEECAIIQDKEETYGSTSEHNWIVDLWPRT